MPKMDAIYEQESAYETSSIMMSQGKLAQSDNISQAMSQTTKFRFNQDGNVDDSSSSDEEIDQVLETEVLQSLNRQLHRSMNVGEVSQSLQFISSKDIPSPNRRSGFPVGSTSPHMAQTKRRNGSASPLNYNRSEPRQSLHEPPRSNMLLAKSTDTVGFPEN